MHRAKEISVVILFLIFQCKISLLSAAPKIAVIGGGIGGASASHYLDELLDGDLSIDLFEGQKLGGRLASVEINGTEYEAGGAIIHERNTIMQRFLQLLGMEKRPSCRNQKFGIWNKDEFVFEESSYAVVTLGKLIYRYGLEPFRLHGYVSSVLDDFEKIYQLQDNGVAFENVTSLLYALNNEFPNMLRISIKDHLEKLGYSAPVINELVESTLVVNYGQETDVQSFVGCVSVAGAGNNLWSVKGGNKEVPEHLIYRNRNVNVILSVVEKIVHISRNDNTSMYEVHYKKSGSSEMMKNIYDIVIITVPLTKDTAMPIKFEEFPKSVNLKFPGTYQTTIATFVHGDLNPKYFNLDDPIDAILSCNPNKTIISSVGNIASVDGKCSRVWKIFTREPLERKTIEEMFTKVDDVKSIRWKAYPNYSEKSPQLNFKLYNSLYHANAIEWAASAMEMSAIGGRNVAILAHNELKNNKHSFKDSSNESKLQKNEKLSSYMEL